MRFLFYIPDSDTVRGGISVIFEIINTLNKNGLNAFALYDRPDFQYDKYVIRVPRMWSPYVRHPDRKLNIKTAANIFVDYFLSRNQKPVGNSDLCSEWKPKSSDIIIVPEYVSDWMPDTLPEGLKLILLVQGPFVLFEAFRRSKFKIRNFNWVISTSDACSAGAEMILGRNAERVSLFISKELYSYNKDKLFQVSYMPRRRSDQSSVIVRALKNLPELKDVPFVPIDNLSSADAAKNLRESLFFLSFSEREGFGLPTAEAMATGALVIGYSGIGGNEFFDESVGFPIPEDDVVMFYNKVVEIILKYSKNKLELDKIRKNASVKILNNYSIDNFESSVLNVFNKVAEKTDLIT